jgi:hypothetical protein
VKAYKVGRIQKSVMGEGYELFLGQDPREAAEAWVADWMVGAEPGVASDVAGTIGVRELYSSEVHVFSVSSSGFVVPC